MRHLVQFFEKYKLSQIIYSTSKIAIALNLPSFPMHIHRDNFLILLHIFF